MSCGQNLERVGVRDVKGLPWEFPDFGPPEVWIRRLIPDRTQGLLVTIPSVRSKVFLGQGWMNIAGLWKTFGRQIRGTGLRGSVRGDGRPRGNQNPHPIPRKARDKGGATCSLVKSPGRMSELTSRATPMINTDQFRGLEGGIIPVESACRGDL